LDATVYLITPPFTQLNTPYPATAYLKGFFNTKGISSFQSDLGIEVTLELFSRKGLSQIFDTFINTDKILSSNAQRIFALKENYIDTIDAVISFLQGNNPTIAYSIAQRNLLPEASRFEVLDDLQWAFGNMGTTDKAKHIATMYLEDIGDLIKETVDEHFGFSRYAERLGRSANSFDELYESLQKPFSFIDEILIELLDKRLKEISPELVAISVPFPGNLFAAFRCAQYIKKNYPNTKVAMGGGFPNTELRSLKDKRVFEYFDFITLDDGEAPLEQLVSLVKGNITVDELKRTFLLADGEVCYINNSACKDYRQADAGTPDYTGLFLTKYIQAIEIINPMHSLWSNGRWNKLTMAHGCYWGKCTFCDISLDYIKTYEPLTASLLCDRMQTMIEATGESGFHFVDEAAPPSLMRELALEIIRRKMVVSWWTNIRFEKTFTRDLCMLLKESGCIGVSGGLEVASDRLLELINKGVTVAQVAKVNRNFTEAGIMVHAYLMYGFPSQTSQETIDSLEMVRQMFKCGILQSAYWHQFAMTAHSPVGMNPEKFGVSIASQNEIMFANNDVAHIDPNGADHSMFTDGLKISLFNYMQQTGLDEPLSRWFDFKVPKTTIRDNHIQEIISSDELKTYKPTSKVVYTGNLPSIEIITKSKKGNQWQLASLTFQTTKKEINVKVDKENGEWLNNSIRFLMERKLMYTTIEALQKSYEEHGLTDFELFWDNKPINQLYKVGLYVY
jgi:radical SAM superfamily enzyme YgiQ (UPF0313 family)